MQILLKIKLGLAGLLMGTVLTVGSVALPVIAYADDTAPAPSSNESVRNSKTYACQGIGLSSGNGGCGGNSDSEVTKVVRSVVNILSIIVGVAAIIMIIVAGFRYTTSGGESSKVSGAKNALIYAIVGLVVVALAQFLVHFVLTSFT